MHGGLSILETLPALSTLSHPVPIVQIKPLLLPLGFEAAHHKLVAAHTMIIQLGLFNKFKLFVCIVQLGLKVSGAELAHGTNLLLVT